MTKLAVSGYSSMDYAVRLKGQIQGDHTTLIEYRDSTAWPRLGGCPAYVAAAVTRQRQQAWPISWIGRDSAAEKYLGDLAAANVPARGIAQLDGQSPTAILAYQSDGSCACLFDPVFSGQEVLTEEQRGIIGGATHVCVTAGPPDLMDEILACRRSDARLYWVCKNDVQCFTREMRATLSELSDVIFCSHSERDLILHQRTGTVVETFGKEWVRVSHDGETKTLKVDPISVGDTTGAGDTLAGGFIAAEMLGVSTPFDAAECGLGAARDMLADRLANERL